MIEAEIAYSGGFHLSVDVDFVFGKSAYLSVIVTKLEGTVHIHLTRLPFTHWSMSFIEVNPLAARVTYNTIALYCPVNMKFVCSVRR